MRKIFTVPALMIITLLLILPSYVLAVTSSAATLNFMCACGACDEALSTCECPQSDDYRSQIAQMVAKGWSEQQIIEDFVYRYGESVLVTNAAAAPQTLGSDPVSATRVGGSKSNTLAVFLIGFGAAAFIFTGVKLINSSRTTNQQKSRNRKQGGGKKSGSKKRSSRGRQRSRKDDEEYLLDD